MVRSIVRAVHTAIINRRIILTTSQVENWISPEETSARARARARYVMLARTS